MAFDYGSDCIGIVSDSFINTGRFLIIFSPLFQRCLDEGDYGEVKDSLEEPESVMDRQVVSSTLSPLASTTFQTESADPLGESGNQASPLPGALGENAVEHGDEEGSLTDPRGEVSDEHENQEGSLLDPDLLPFDGLNVTDGTDHLDEYQVIQVEFEVEAKIMIFSNFTLM